MALFISRPPRAVSLGSQSLKKIAYTNTSLPKRTSCIFQQKKTRELRYGNCKTRKTNNRSSNHVEHNFVSSCLRDESVSPSDSYSNSPTEMIEKFYSCINDKNSKELSNCISEGCIIEDSLFNEPFIGKKVKTNYYIFCISILIHTAINV